MFQKKFFYISMGGHLPPLATPMYTTNNHLDPPQYRPQPANFTSLCYVLKTSYNNNKWQQWQQRLKWTLSRVLRWTVDIICAMSTCKHYQHINKTIHDEFHRQITITVTADKLNKQLWHYCNRNDNSKKIFGSSCYWRQEQSSQIHTYTDNQTDR
jgi:hypothetical protein